jgi:hypothetical protein
MVFALKKVCLGLLIGLELWSSESEPQETRFFSSTNTLYSASQQAQRDGVDFGIF